MTQPNLARVQFEGILCRHIRSESPKQLADHNQPTIDDDYNSIVWTQGKNTNTTTHMDRRIICPKMGGL